MTGSVAPLLCSGCRCSCIDHTRHGSENMTYSTKKSTLSRAFALGLSVAMMSALALVGATPAAAAPEYYSVTGVVHGPDAAALSGVGVSLTYTPEGSSSVVSSDVTANDGSFTLTDVPVGTHILSFVRGGYDDNSVSTTVTDADVVLGTTTMVLALEELAAGTAAISGTPVVGNELTAVTAGWPTGTTFTYDWGYNAGNMGGSTGVTTPAFTVTSDLIGTRMVLIVTGSLQGYAPSTASAFLDTVTSAPKKAAAPAPVSDSAGLAAFLAANASTPADQTSAGLPSGAIDPGKSHTANLGWTGADSFVDVYAYSSPVFVGTFPVVNGVAQITLSPAVLGQLAAGTHTLVVIGQSSGAVQSLTLALGLAATGFDATAPVTVASLLMLVGATLMTTRRRFAARG